MTEFSIDKIWRHPDGFIVAECTSYRTQEKFIAQNRWGSWMANRTPFDRKTVEDGPWSDIIHEWAAILQDRALQLDKKLDKLVDNPFANPQANPFLAGAA